MNASCSSAWITISPHLHWLKLYSSFWAQLKCRLGGVAVPNPWLLSQGSSHSLWHIKLALDYSFWCLSPEATVSEPRGSLWACPITSAKRGEMFPYR